LTSISMFINITRIKFQKNGGLIFTEVVVSAAFVFNFP